MKILQSFTFCCIRTFLQFPLPPFLSQRDREFARASGLVVLISEAMEVVLELDCENKVKSTTNHSQRRVGLLYDERMCKHYTPDNDYHPENPNRIRAIWEKLEKAGIHER